jgi:hypothetical protein
MPPLAAGLALRARGQCGSPAGRRSAAVAVEATMLAAVACLIPRRTGNDSAAASRPSTPAADTPRGVCRTAGVSSPSNAPIPRRIDLARRPRLGSVPRAPRSRWWRALGDWAEQRPPASRVRVPFERRLRPPSTSRVAR